MPGGTDPSGATEGSARVFRGGCWATIDQGCGSAYRSLGDPLFKSNLLGFRLALAPVADAPTTEIGSSVSKTSGDALPPAVAPTKHVLPNGWVFDPPVNMGMVVVNSQSKSISPAFSSDERTVYFQSTRTGGQGGDDLWMSKRSSINEPFGPPANLGPVVNSDSKDRQPDISSDGLTLIFSSDRTGGQGGPDLWMSARASLDEPFGPPVNLGPDINGPSLDGGPHLSSDGLTLIFSSIREGGQGGYDLCMSTRDSPDESFAALVNLGGVVNSTGREDAPTLTADGLTLVFQSDQPGGQGDADLWMSTRASPDEAFGPAVNLGPVINSDVGDFSPTFSADGQTLYFNSNRPSDEARSELWMARIRRPDLLKRAPPAAVAPFDEAKAKQHQKAWAGHLGVSVEKSVELPGGETMNFILIPPGEFMMGSTAEDRARFVDDAGSVKDQWSIDRISHESPQHRVRISQPFYLGCNEVTQTQWHSVMDTNPSKFPDDKERPVENVSWDHVQSFLEELNVSDLTADDHTPKSSRVTFELPTEAQWEYACRAGTTSPFFSDPNAKEVSDHAWFDRNSDGTTRPVGELAPNAFGLFDMHGNVYEWCNDRFSGVAYTNTMEVDPTGPPTGNERVARGGSWGAPLGRCRSAIRTKELPSERNDSLGFRVAMSIDIRIFSRSSKADRSQVDSQNTDDGKLRK